MEKLFGVKQNGAILPIAESNEVVALQKAAKHVFGRKTSGSVGKLMLSGAKVIQVEIVEKSSE